VFLLEQQISIRLISEGSFDDPGVMMLKIQLCYQMNKLHFKIYLNSQQIFL